MSRATLIALSLAANAALAGVLWHRHTGSTTRAVSPADSAASRPVPTTPPRVPLTLDPHTWSKLTSGNDDAAFVARLRAEGFPPRVVRSLVRSVLQQRAFNEYRDLIRQDIAAPYWRNRNGTLRPDREARQKLAALDKKLTEQARALLGPDVDRLPGDVGYSTVERQYGPIPPEKVAAIKAISRDYDEISSDLHEASRGLLLREDREKLAFIETQKRADLTALLTPEELDHYERRNSNAAYTTRERFEFLDATESEFLAVYRLQHDFDRQYGELSDTARASQRKAALPQLEARIETALGPDRVADYRIVTDDNFSTTRAFVTDLGLQASDAKPLVRTQRDFSQRRKTLLADKTLSSQEKNSALVRLEQEAVSAIASSLGTERSLLYKTSSAGQWLRRFGTLENEGP